MCGRYASARSVDDLVVTFAADGTEGDPGEPSWNVAPTDPVPVVVEHSRQPTGHGRRRVVRPARWGLVPGWAPDTRGAARLINARVETVATAPAFRGALSRRRCVIPADGWYEWHLPGAEPGGAGPAGRDATPGRVRKVPSYLHRSDGQVLAFAGVFERWSPPPPAAGPVPADADPVWTVAIITGPAVGRWAWVHDRMPAVVRPGRLDEWLDRGLTDGPAALACLVPAGALDLAAHRVGGRVGDVRAQGPHLAAPVGSNVEPDRDGVSGPALLF